jgi:hypothetical protein
VAPLGARPAASFQPERSALPLSSASCLAKSGARPALVKSVGAAPLRTDGPRVTGNACAYHGVLVLTLIAGSIAMRSSPGTAPSGLGEAEREILASDRSHPLNLSGRRAWSNAGVVYAARSAARREAGSLQVVADSGGPRRLPA